MKLTKAQRATLREMFGGRCAYCGQPLGDRWHADHVEPVRRNDWFKKIGFAPRPPEHQERDNLDNLMPACAPCNIDKHSMSLEDWRGQMQRSHDVLQRDNSTYRRMLRYRMVLEERHPIVFHFEREERLNQPLTRCAAGRDGDCVMRQCPQTCDGEPAKSGRSCPLARWDGEDE